MHVCGACRNRNPLMLDSGHDLRKLFLSPSSCLNSNSKPEPPLILIAHKHTSIHRQPHLPPPQTTPSVLASRRPSLDPGVSSAEGEKPTNEQTPGNFLHWPPSHSFRYPDFPSKPTPPSQAGLTAPALPNLPRSRQDSLARPSNQLAGYPLHRHPFAAVICIGHLPMSISRHRSKSMASPSRKQPEAVADKVLKRAEVGKVRRLIAFPYLHLSGLTTHAPPHFHPVVVHW